MKNLISFFVKNHIWSWVIVFFVLVAGIFSFKSLKRSFFPERRIEYITISVAFPGASPQEVEEGITLKIEDGLKGIPGIEEVTSSSRENSASISVKILKGYDEDEVLSDVENAVNQINSYPEQAEKPKVFKQKPTDKAIYLSLYGDREMLDLKKMAEQIEDDFLASGHMSQISIAGFPELEFSIEINEDQLLRYGLTFEQIAMAVSRNNRDISAGSIKTDEEEILIRSRQKTTLAYELEDIVLRSTSQGTLIRLKDVADVKFQFADSPNKVLYNGLNSVSINVSKLPEEDIIVITDFVKEYIEEFNNRYADYQMSIISDRSIGLNQRIDLLAENGIVGLILVVITLGIFLNLRLSIWVAMGIPISFLGMIIIANMVGITINQISLFGMILVIGILVDDGIVIAENIFSHLEKGEPPIKATVNGTLEVFPSVFASVMTTIIAFSAFFFIDGTIGEFMREMAIVVIACLAFSLIEAALILPSHLTTESKAARNKKGTALIGEEIKSHYFKGKGIRFYLEKGINWLRFDFYGGILKFSIRYRWFMVIPLSFLFFAVIGGLQSGGFVKFAFFPNIETNSIIADIEMKPGTRDEETIDYLKEIEKAVWRVNDSLKKERSDSLDVVESTRVSVGRNFTSATGSHVGSLEIRMLEAETRNMKNYEVAALIRDEYGKVPPEIEKFSIGAVSGFGKPVAVRLLSSDANQLNKAKEEFKEELRKLSDLKDVVDNDVLGQREVNLNLKPRAYFLGLTHQDITNQVRQGFFGYEIQRLQIGADEVKVWVRYPQEDRRYLSKLENMRVKTADGNEYPLTELVDYSIERGPVDIKHYDGAREVMVEADMRNPDGASGPIIDQINNVILPEILEKYPSVSTRNSGQKQEQEKMTKSAGPVIVMILIAIYFVLVLVFNSWFQPFMVLWMIPFGIMGGIFGHFIHDKAVVIMSYFGFIALLGVIVNDAVVFLDRYNQNIKEGQKVVPAIYSAGLSRFRPIVLTSVTTVAGLFPLIFEKSTQAQFLIPMAISVAYGVLFGTMFILLLFPAVIMAVNDVRYWLRYVWFGRKHATLSVWEGRWMPLPNDITREEGEPVIKRKHNDDDHSEG